MPRRSNACETCKRRKVKCDEGKPTCDRCARQGYECEGYVDRTAQRRRSPAFRDQTQRVAEKAEASYVRSSHSGSGAASTNTPSSSSAARDAAALLRKFAQIHEDEWPTLLLSSKPRMAYLPPLARIDESRERRAQLVSNFIYSYLPTTDGGAIWQSNYTYMYTLQDFTGQHPAIPSAVDALCLAIAGLTHGDANLVAKARNIYGAALNRLAATLNKARAYAPTGTMAAIAVLAWCELNQGGLSGSGGGDAGSGGALSGSSAGADQYAAAAAGSVGRNNNANAWENHVEGAVTLLESFEPECWDTNEGRMLLQGLRYGVITVCLIRRRAVAVFTQPRWSGLVEATHSTDDPWVHLNDLSAHIPELLEEGDRLMASFESSGGSSAPIGPVVRRAVNSLLQRSLHLRAQLHQWYAELEANTPPDAERLVTSVSQDWWEPTGFDDAMPLVLAYSEYRQCHLRAMIFWVLLTLDEHILLLNDCGLIRLPSDDIPSGPSADAGITSPYIPSAPFSPSFSSSFSPNQPTHHEQQHHHAAAAATNPDPTNDEYSTHSPFDPSFDHSFPTMPSAPSRFLVTPPSRAQLDAEALHFAEQAARTVPVSFDPATPPVSKYNAAVSLRLAADAFAARHMHDRVAWCRALEKRLERAFFIPELMRIVA